MNSASVVVVVVVLARRANKLRLLSRRSPLEIAAAAARQRQYSQLPAAAATTASSSATTSVCSFLINNRPLLENVPRKQVNNANNKTTTTTQRVVGGVREWSNSSNKSHQASGKKNNNNTTKKKSNSSNKKPTASAAAGRVAIYQPDGGKGGTKLKLCFGCGSRITSSSSSSSPSTLTMRGGYEAAVEDQYLSKNQAKYSRYFDVNDKAQNTSSILCDRCKALKQGEGNWNNDNDNNNNDNNPGIWGAYDALRDVEPRVFFDQLSFVVKRRKFGIGVVVLDVTDSEHTLVGKLRDAVGSIPLIVVWNKIDLMPRFGYYDRKTMENAVRKNLRFERSFAVSAQTGVGLTALAEDICQNLGGRDVFVMGAANVGKSTLVKRLASLIAESVFMKGKGKNRERRRQQTSSLQVTGSHLPGTTLQAVRIPCFESDRHALWDTPGIINHRALQYNLFPSHPMEPLTRSGEIQIPSREDGNAGDLRPGSSMLIQTTWMCPSSTTNEEEEDHDNDSSGQQQPRDEECTLARIDLVQVDAEEDYRDVSVFAQAYLHPSLRVKIVPTSRAPDRATIPSCHIRRIQQKIQDATGQSDSGLKDQYELPLTTFLDKVQPGMKEQGRNGTYYMDIVFASLGWIAFTCGGSFTVVPHTVKDSVFSKRKSIYPVTLNYEELEEQHLDSIEEGEEDSQKRIRAAAKEGRHLSNRRPKEATHCLL